MVTYASPMEAQLSGWILEGWGRDPQGQPCALLRKGGLAYEPEYILVPSGPYLRMT